MKKGKIISIILSVVLLVTAVVGITAFADDGYYDMPAENFGKNLTADSVESALDANGNDIAKAIDGDVNTSWKASGKTASVTLTFKEPTTFNTVVLREKNWKIRSFALSYLKEDENGEHWETFYCQDAVEDFRVCAFDTITTKQLKFEAFDASGIFKIREIEVYNTPKMKRDDFRVTDYIPSSELRGCAFATEYCEFVDQIMIIPAFYWNDDGTLAFSEDFTTETMKAEVDRLRGIYGEKDVDILATAYVNQCNPTTVLTEHKDEIVKNTIAMLKEVGFDGVSYDWEYPVGEQWDLFSEHLAAIKNELVKEDMILSCALSCGRVKLTPEAIAAIDSVEIMSYDNFDYRGNHSSFMSGAVQPINYMLSLGFKPEQLRLGLPIYGRPDNGDGDWPYYNNEPEDSIDRFTNFINGNWYSGTQMTVDKTATALAYNLGGIMIYYAGCDFPYENDLSCMRALKETLDSRMESEATENE